MRINLLTAVILLAVFASRAALVFAQDEGTVDGSQKGAISGSMEEKNEPEPEQKPEPEPKSTALKFPGFGIGVSLGGTMALTTVEGSGLLADGGGLEMGLMAGWYPLIFGEMGVEGMRFDLTTETDKEANRRVRVETYGYYAGGGGALPLEEGAIGFRYRIQRKSLAVLEVENRDTDQTDTFRDRVTRRSYFIFYTGGEANEKGENPGFFFEIGLRYDDVDENVFLISDVIGAYLRLHFMF